MAVRVQVILDMQGIRHMLVVLNQLEADTQEDLKVNLKKKK